MENAFPVANINLAMLVSGDLLAQSLQRPGGITFRPEKHGEGYTMSHDDVLGRVKWAADQGATQIMIQGGVNPDLRIERTAEGNMVVRRGATTSQAPS